MSDPIPPQPPYTDVPYTEVPNAGPSMPPPAPASSGLSDNSAAALAYITIIPAVIFLVLEPYNRIPLVRFHSVQCLALAVSAFVLHMAVTAGRILFHFIPLSWMFFSLLHLAVSVVIFVAWLMAIIRASKGEFYKLPIIGDFAMNQIRS